ncbi:hypothetical protein SEMRO_482_G151720.1 [Seminavis robusta]|uniref:Uncharacterized protein n=1 Tax=Seminavis robusta TaxID=568900 RepID=A0A9N8DZ07_9STRA|nr:hypothetical protein SEMRO_482_G151720.1 [Seminavis robusta]|eukprot:Sro482_g151720.1 n/a (191) ;mRNA; r:4142-4714
MQVNKDAFDKFVLTNGESYPYCDVRITRQKFHCKWLMLASGAILNPVLSSSFDAETCMHLILTKTAFPLSNDASHVMDVLDKWGKKYNPIWFEDVCCLFNKWHRQGKPLCREYTFYHVLRIRIEKRLQAAVPVEAIAVKDSIFVSWHQHFVVDYVIHQDDFWRIACNSFHFVQDRIDQYHASPAEVMSSP